MIVTRKRRKPFPWKRLILPLIAVAFVVFAASWGPSRNVIENGPTAPLWRGLSNTFGTVATPFHFAAQNRLLDDRNKQIVQLQNQVAGMQTKDSAKDKQLSSLQSQLGQLQAQAASARSAPAAKNSPVASATALPGAVAAGATDTQSASGDLSAGATADMRRTASYWANMEPENAAKVVQKLPALYVARIFALMSPDSASSIMDALPAAYVAQLTQERPELKR
ncbi:MAG TPA: hypothetical protein VGN11_11060 [Candidatus Baltobacteraceae bacterium]|nr:hypothetical protein [Candidatus Baltobacteraceae bacterium]